MLQQQVRNLHKEKGGGQTQSPGAASVLEASPQSWQGNSERGPKRDPLQLGRWGSESPHPGSLQGQPTQVSSLQGRQKSRAHGAADGGGCQHGHTARILAPGSCFVQVGMKTDATGWPDKRSCKRLGVLTHMCRLFCREGITVLGIEDQRKPL